MLLGTTSFAHANLAQKYGREKITVAVSPSWPPFSYLDDGGYMDGYLIDFWKLWERKTGITVKFRHLYWKETIDKVAAGEVDVHSGLYISPERLKLLEYCQPYYKSKAVLALRKDGKATCDDAYSSATIGLVDGGYEAAYVQKHHPDADTVIFRGTRKMVKQFMDGDFSAMVIDHPSLVTFMRLMHLDMNDVEICGTLYVRDMHPAVQKGNHELVQIVNEGLALISKEEKRYIEERWFVNEEVGPDWQKAVMVSVSVLLAISGAVMFWTTRNKRRRK